MSKGKFDVNSLVAGSSAAAILHSVHQLLTSVQEVVFLLTFACVHVMTTVFRLFLPITSQVWCVLSVSTKYHITI